ncbi:MAG: hypothetical protein AB7G23_03110 [Vicinamibacterales bacterium]
MAIGTGYDDFQDDPFSGYSFEGGGAGFGSPNNAATASSPNMGAPANSFGTGAGSSPVGPYVPPIDDAVTRGWYTEMLDREATDADVASHQNNPGGQAGIYNSIIKSPEFDGNRQVQTYRSQVQALQNETDPARAAQLQDALARDLYAGLQQAGHEVSWEGNQLMIDGRLYDLADARGAAAGGSGGSGGSGGGGGLRPSGYAPVDSLDDLTYPNAFANAGYYRFGGIAPTAADAATEDLVLSILRNPESLGPQVVDQLKARSKDELAEMQRTREGELLDSRFRLGYERSSPFFESERAAGRRDYDTALVSGNRDIDITAATQNFGDRLSALGAGEAFTGERFDRAATAEGLKQGEAASRQAAVSLAGQLALNRAALLTDDRQFDAQFGLNELLANHQIDEDLYRRVERALTLAGG